VRGAPLQVFVRGGPFFKNNKLETKNGAGSDFAAAVREAFPTPATVCL